jgi:hypothetical protein
MDNGAIFIENSIFSMRGTFPCLLTCSHGGNGIPDFSTERTGTDLPEECIKSFRTSPDSFILGIVMGLAKNILHNYNKGPFVIVENIHRKYVDVNRPHKCAYIAKNAKDYYDLYHTTIVKFIQDINTLCTSNNALGFLFDIHGTEEEFDYKSDIVVGTNNGKCISTLLKTNANALWDNNGLIKLLQDRNYDVSPTDNDQMENLMLNECYVITKYGSSKGKETLQSIQIGISPSIRRNVIKRKKFERDFADCIMQFISMNSKSTSLAIKSKNAK